MRRAKVYMRKYLAGIITETDSKEYIFRYDDVYFRDNSMPEISLTMTKEKQEYTSERLFPFFENMLSEGSNRELQMRLFRLDEKDSFGLLLATAKHDTIGAITIKAIEDDE